MLFDADTDPHNASSIRAQHSCFNLICINTGTMRGIVVSLVLPLFRAVERAVGRWNQSLNR